jgi:hypothetical protein
MSARKKLYTVYYNDGTFLSYKLTKVEYDSIFRAICTKEPVVNTAIGLLVVTDVRSVIAQITVPIVQNKAAEPGLSAEEAEWLASQRLAERAFADEQYDTDDLDEETEYVGGMLNG